MSATFQPLLNTASKLPADGKVQICPLGEAGNYCPQRRKRVMQVVDVEALSLMAAAARAAAAAGDAEILVDADHLSHNAESDTRALGWLQNATVEARADGLYGTVNFTPPGLEAVEGRVYRYGSPEFLPGDCVDIGERGGLPVLRPARLAGFALTNRPNFRNFKPIKNRETDPAATIPAPMKQILKLLQLPDGASEDAAAERLQALLNDGKRAADDLQALRNSVADETLVKYADRLVNADAKLKESFKAMLLTNREQAVSILDSLPPAAQQQQPPAPLHNRATAQPPAAVSGPDAAARQRQAAKVRSRAEEMLRNRSAGNLSEAFARAKAEMED